MSADRRVKHLPAVALLSAVAPVLPVQPRSLYRRAHRGSCPAWLFKEGDGRWWVDVEQMVGYYCQRSIELPFAVVIRAPIAPIAPAATTNSTN